MSKKKSVSKNSNNITPQNYYFSDSTMKTIKQRILFFIVFMSLLCVFFLFLHDYSRALSVFLLFIVLLLIDLCLLPYLKSKEFFIFMIILNLIYLPIAQGIHKEIVYTQIKKEPSQIFCGYLVRIDKESTGKSTFYTGYLAQANDYFKLTSLQNYNIDLGDYMCVEYTQHQNWGEWIHNTTITPTEIPICQVEKKTQHSTYHYTLHTLYKPCTATTNSKTASTQAREKTTNINDGLEVKIRKSNTAPDAVEITVQPTHTSNNIVRVEAKSTDTTKETSETIETYAD